MNKKLFFGALAFASFGMVACSEDENIPEVNTPNEEIEVQEGFKTLTQIHFESVLGTAKGGSAESRTPGDIDKDYCPTQNYYLPYVWMVAVNPERQPTVDSIGHVVDLGYLIESENAKQHFFHNNQYRLDYSLRNIVSNANCNASHSGTIILSHRGEQLPFKLSVFDKKMLKDGNRIALNDFAYDVVTKNHRPVRGTSLRYLSYNPYNVNDYMYSSGAPVDHSKLAGQFVALPQLEGYDMLKEDFDIAKNLVSETPDRFFTGSEFLVAADDEAVYLLKVVDKDNANGGYFQVRKYTDIPDGQAEPDYLSMNRLTTMINASFMLIPEDGEPEYFVRKNEAQTLKNYKNLYHVDLSTLACPYATIDGVHTHFHLNEYKEPEATDKQGRLALWAKGHEITAVNGQKYDKQPERSMDIEYHHGGKHSVTRAGYGIEGKSYTVAFPTADKWTAGQSINFWVEVAGQKIKINAPIDENAGIALSSNCSHNIIVFIPARKFANAVNNPATRSNGYAELNLNSGCVVSE